MNLDKLLKILNERQSVNEMPFETGVKLMLDEIDHWKDAPLWDKETISNATKTWFKYMSN